MRVRVPAQERPDAEDSGDAAVDVVVVGGGTAGCIVAARLSEDPRVRVTLLERGGTEPPESRVPAFLSYITARANVMEYLQVSAASTLAGWWCPEGSRPALCKGITSCPRPRRIGPTRAGQLQRHGVRLHAAQRARGRRRGQRHAVRPGQLGGLRRLGEAGTSRTPRTPRTPHRQGGWPWPRPSKSLGRIRAVGAFIAQFSLGNQ